MPEVVGLRPSPHRKAVGVDAGRGENAPPTLLGEPVSGLRPGRQARQQEPEDNRY